VAGLRYNTYLIDIANAESCVNAVTSRPDNPALKVKRAGTPSIRTSSALPNP